MVCYSSRDRGRTIRRQGQQRPVTAASDTGISNCDRAGVIDQSVQWLSIIVKGGKQMPTIPAGTYRIGTNTMDGFAEDLEGPQISLDSPAFAIDATTVTNQAFQVFVEATGYVTEAERFGWSFVFHYF